LDESDRRSVEHVRRELLAWYDQNARDLPWRRTRDPYAIWISEIMLQQTRVETVLPYYARFLERFPSVGALAEAPEADVLAMWSGLGYYRRARLLHRGARHVAEMHGGRLPADVDAIRAIPGVGAYTTGAIGSQAFDLEAPLVDGNVARVAARLCAIEDDVKKGKGLARAWRIAGELVRGPRPGALNNALMELGAVVCVPREPRCLLCPVRDACAARARGRERELPVATTKPERPRIREIAAVLRVAGEPAVLLARCRENGLFAGLWEPPRITTTDVYAARAALSAMLGVAVTLEPEETRHVEHVLTHRVLDLAVHEGTIDRAMAPRQATSVPANDRYDAWELVDLDRLKERGVSTFAKKLLGARRAGRRSP
jgi:A/G-specific adenine glycosylase